MSTATPEFAAASVKTGRDCQIAFRPLLRMGYDADDARRAFGKCDVFYKSDRQVDRALRRGLALAIRGHSFEHRDPLTPHPRHREDPFLTVTMPTASLTVTAGGREHLMTSFAGDYVRPHLRGAGVLALRDMATNARSWTAQLELMTSDNIMKEPELYDRMAYGVDHGYWGNRLRTAAGLHAAQAVLDFGGMLFSPRARAWGLFQEAMERGLGHDIAVNTGYLSIPAQRIEDAPWIAPPTGFRAKDWRDAFEQPLQHMAGFEQAAGRFVRQWGAALAETCLRKEGSIP